MTQGEFRAARKAMGHTQHTLAEALKMGRHGWQTISAWETGKTPIPGPVQVAMDHLLNCGTKRKRETAGENTPANPQKS